MLKFIFVLSLSGDEDVFSGESLSSGAFSGVGISTNGGSSLLDVSVERNRGEVSLASSGRSKFRDSNGADGEDRGVSAVSVVSGLDEEGTNKTSNSTSTENDKGASIIKVADVISQETQTESPSVDERKDDHVEEHVEDNNSLDGDSFTHHGGGNSGSNDSLSASPEEMSILVVLVTDELVELGIEVVAASIVSFSTNERSIDVTETPSETENPHPPNSHDKIDEDFVPDDSGILSSNGSDFHKTETNKHQEDKARGGDNPSLVETKGEISDGLLEESVGSSSISS